MLTTCADFHFKILSPSTVYVVGEGKYEALCLILHHSVRLFFGIISFMRQNMYVFSIWK